MSFDLSVKRLRAVVLDWDGMVVVAEEVGFDGREGGRDVGNGSNGVGVGNGIAWEDELAVYGYVRLFVLVGQVLFGPLVLTLGFDSLADSLGPEAGPGSQTTDTPALRRCTSRR